MEIRNSPLLTRSFEDPSLFAPAPNSVYIGLHGIEERSHHSQGGIAKSTTFLHVNREGENDFDIDFGDGEVKTISLRSRSQLNGIWTTVSADTVYLDITGLRHHIWIPLLKSAVDARVNLHAIYVEPESYKASMTPTEGQIYDLSEKTLGISPIPGFATFSRTPEEFLFVPLLGFEGTRISYLLEQVQPVYDKIVPIVGVRGFKPEHPFNSYFGNRIALQETNAWHRIEFADANCPFSLYYLLNDIYDRSKIDHIKIALVGTKPHALGAVLFTLEDKSRRELIYDHPIRKSKRTAGKGRLLEYEVAPFLK